MKNRAYATRPYGFSLIEVLVAVVIFSFGLLALAALQGSVFKASGDAKAQSVGLGLAAEKLEYFRGFKDIAVYQSIISGSDAATFNVGGVVFTRSWTVTRCAYPVAGGSFDCAVAVSGATANTYVQNNEFKRVVVNVTWADAQGGGQRVSLEEAISALNPSDSAKIGKLALGARSRGPEVRIYNPAMQQQGVIPIAIGNGTDTAATNPKPLVNSTSVIETRFNVLTYNGLSGNTAIEQARVETSVVGCSCDYNNAPTGGGKRPTFWTGKQYSIPENSNSTALLGASYTPPAGPDASASAQSAVCTICCRDHHDPSALPAGAAKFDPRDINHSAGHYLLNTSSGIAPGTISAQRTSGKYTEACRVIRVGGLFRVAADLYNDYQNFLDTKNDNSTTAYLPTTAAISDYQNYVKGYLDARVVNQTTQANWNDVLPITAPGTVSALETTNSVYANQPVVIRFNKTDPDKWLHLRGLYVDWLEDKALQAIQDAKDGCVGTGSGGTVTTADLQSCVLKVLPFTSINLTELGIYSPLSGNQIVVANNNFYDTLSSTAPVRGKVVLGGNPTNGQPTDAVAKMRRSNSGLTTLLGGIDTEDRTTTAPSTWTATQPFAPSGVVGGGTGGQFFVNMTGYPFTQNANTPSINDSIGATCNYLASSTPNYVCTSSTLGVPRLLTFGKYNFSLPVTQTALTLTCRDSANNNPVAHTFSSLTSKTINVCRNFSVTPGVLTTSDGVLAEQTATTFSSVPFIKDGDTVGVSVAEQTQAQAYTCSYAVGADTSLDASYSVSPASCP